VTVYAIGGAPVREETGINAQIITGPVPAYAPVITHPAPFTIIEAPPHTWAAVGRVTPAGSFAAKDLKLPGRRRVLRYLQGAGHYDPRIGR
jgi:hypothetical protein